MVERYNENSAALGMYFDWVKDIVEDVFVKKPAYIGRRLLDIVKNPRLEMAVGLATATIGVPFGGFYVFNNYFPYIRDESVKLLILVPLGAAALAVYFHGGKRYDKKREQKDTEVKK